METCVYGHIFRESVMVRNRASVAMKIQAWEVNQFLKGDPTVHDQEALLRSY